MARSILIVVTLISLLTFLTNLRVTGQRPARITNEYLANTVDYDEIHRRAVEDQVGRDFVRSIRSLEIRHRQSLNGIYDFCLDPNSLGFKQKWYSQPFRNFCQPYRMPVPSAFQGITSNRTVRDFVGWFWYQTKIPQSSLVHLSAAPTIYDWFLQFDSVNYMTFIWVQAGNRVQLVASHVGGYLPIVANLSGLVNEATLESKWPLRLTVAVSNILSTETIPSGTVKDYSAEFGVPYKQFVPDFDFFHFAGILGDVNLIRLPKLHIESVELLRDQYHESCQVAVQVCLSQPVRRLRNSEAFDLKISLFDALGLEVDTMKSYSEFWDIICQVVSGGNSLAGAPKQKSCFARNNCQTFYSFQDKSCHESRNGSTRHEHSIWPLEIRVELNLRETTLTNAETTSRTTHDAYQVRYFKPNDYFGDRLAGVTGSLMGFGMHQEEYFSGRTMSSAAITKDIYLLKQMGANVIRTSHYPYSESYLDACDEHGIMVIAECQAVGLKSFSETKLKLHKQLLREMFIRDHHHSSIIMWSLANEPQSQLAEAQKYFESLVEFARSDMAHYTVRAKRPLTAAVAQSHKDDKIGHLLDVVMINRYYGWYDYEGAIESIEPKLTESLLGWATKHPGKLLLISEFGAEALAGLHSSSGDQMFSEEYQRDLLIEHERVIGNLLDFGSLEIQSDSKLRSNSTWQIKLIGSMIWNFADFSTHNSVSRAGGNKKGVFTRFREPKLAAKAVGDCYSRRSRAEMAAIASSHRNDYRMTW